MVILTLPTGRYIAGAAAAVALTGLAGALAPRLPPPAAAHPPRPPGAWCRRRPPAASPPPLLAALVAIGFLGSRDPLANLLPLTVWTLVWVGLPLATLLFGNLWRDVEPWTGPVRLARRLLGRQGAVGLARLGHWPAVAGFLAFAWFEIVSLAPADPAVLARAVLGYWSVVFLLAVLEGEDWLARGEAFTVFFALIARIAPFWAEPARRPPAGDGRPARRADPARAAARPERRRLRHAGHRLGRLRRPRRHLLVAGPARHQPAGVPRPLGGRRAPTPLGLLAAWALTAATVLGAIALGRRLAGRRGGFWRDAGPLLLSFLPIAAGYHGAHYLVALLTDGQYAVAALGDPLGRGWNLFGLPHHWVSFAFLSDRAGALAVWNAQFALILGAHLLAVMLSLRLMAGAPPRAHLPMTVLMVLYTVFGLWLLAAPTGA